jgi:hypothetical protein
VTASRISVSSTSSSACRPASAATVAALRAVGQQAEDVGRDPLDRGVQLGRPAMAQALVRGMQVRSGSRKV